MDIRNVAKLKLRASALLNVLLLLGETASRMKREDIMRLSGINNVNHYYQARKELTTLGFVEMVPQWIPDGLVIPSLRSGITRYLEENDPSFFLSRQGSVPLPEPRETVTVFEESTDLVPGKYEIGTPQYEIGTTDTDLVLEDTSSVPASTKSVLDEYEIGTSDTDLVLAPLSLYDRCMDADSLDGSGDIFNRFSPFQARRKVQIPLVQEAWAEFFPKANALTEENAKRFLSWCGNLSSKVYDELADLAQRNPREPITYVRTVLEKRFKEQSAAPTPPAPVRQQQQQQEVVDELPPPSPEFLEKLRQAEERRQQWLKKMGLPE